MVVFGASEVVQRLVRVIKIIIHDLWDINDFWMTFAPICSSLSCQTTTNPSPDLVLNNGLKLIFYQMTMTMTLKLVLKWFFYSIVP